jgi:hypothetical protein
MGIVNKAVQDGIGVSRIADHAVPMIYWKRDCHKSGAAAITLLEDFEKVLPGLGVEYVQTEIVEDKKIGAAEFAQKPGMAAVAPGKGKIGKQSRHPAIENGVIVTAGLMTKRARKRRIFDAVTFEEVQALLLKCTRRLRALIAAWRKPHRLGSHRSRDSLAGQLRRMDCG